MGDVEPSATSPESVARVIAQALSADVVGAPVRLTGGFNNESWVAGVEGAGKVLLRVARPTADVRKVRAAWQAQELAAAAGVPTGRCLRFWASCEPLHGRAARLVEFVDGPRADEVLSEGTATMTFFASLGAALAKVHAVRLDAFSSRVDGSASCFARWSEYVAWRVPSIVRRGVESGAFSEAEIVEIFSVLPDLCARVDPVVTPALSHRDLHLPNIVADSDGKVRAIVDWDAAEAWDPMVDFVKLRWQVIGRFPGAEQALWSGYSSGELPPMLEERLRIVDLLELTDGVANSRLEGWSECEAQNRRWLALAKAAG
jgi:aminoglycoside phosphotransferase (APT) family kinase protein